MTPDTLKLIKYALTIIERRSTDEDRTVESRIAYGAAFDMINYALDGAYDNLAQFDY